MFPSVFPFPPAHQRRIPHHGICLRHECPIINPLDQGIKDAFINAKLLLGFDKGAANFIAETAKIPAPAEKFEASQDLPPLEQIRAAVKNGERNNPPHS